MFRIATCLYATLSYALFLGVFLYVMGCVGGLMAPVRLEGVAVRRTPLLAPAGGTGALAFAPTPLNPAQA
jgi:hypothetical protein